MEKLTLPVALIAFLPVLLAIGGFFYLARLIARLNRECGRLAWVGVALIFAGGLSQLSWAFIFAITGKNIRPLDNLLLILVTPGSICLMWALWNAFRPIGQVPVWVIPVILMSMIEGAAAINALSKGGGRWFFILLGSMTLATLATSGFLLRETWRRRLDGIGYLFAFHLGAVMLQPYLIGLPSQTIALQWGKLLISLLAWSAFLIGVRNFARVLTGNKE